MVPMEHTPSCWVEELPAVLWSIRTTPNRSSNYMPFFMVYGAEAVLPSDIHHDLPMWWLTCRQLTRRLAKMLSMLWKRNVISQQYTNKTCVAIIAAEFEAGCSRKAT